MPRYLTSNNCTVQRRNGNFCDAPSAPDMPFPICGRHAREVYHHLRVLLADVATDMVEQAYAQRWDVDRIRQEQIQRRNGPDHRVYYVRVGDLIKIGATGSLATRMHAYPPDSELLATEAGGHDLEAERLAQFGHLKAKRREWFHPGAALIAHIESLRQPV